MTKVSVVGSWIQTSYFFFFLKQDLRLLISANCQHLVEDSEQMRKAGAHGHLGVSLYHCGQMK